MSDRIPATVTWVGDGYVHVIDDHGQTYFVFHNAVEQTGRWSFDDLWIGSKVILTPIQHPKGWRGLDVKIVEV